MNFGVRKVRASDWAADGACVDKMVELHTDIGVRTHAIMLFYTPAKAGGVLAISSLRFNFRILPDSDQGNSWFRVEFSRLGEVGAVVALQCKENEDGSWLISDDPKTFEIISAVLSISDQWTVDVCGPEGSIFSFIIPADDNFDAAFVSMHKAARTL